MRTVSIARTKENTIPPAKAARGAHESVRRLIRVAEKARTSLDYVARNMHEAFDGDLGDVEANAYAALTGVVGELLTLDEGLRDMERSALDNLVAALTTGGAS